MPSPARLAPRSLTTTLQPSWAMRIAIPRPMPRPAPVTSADFPSSMPIDVSPFVFGADAAADARSGRRRQGVEGASQRPVEGLGLIQVGRVAGALDDLELRASDLLGHVLARGDERRVLVADDDERWHADLRQRVDQARVLLGEHAARRVGEALRGLVVA